MLKMKELYEKVAADSVLQDKFKEIMASSEQAGAEQTMEKLVAFAKEAGFEVSPEEIKSFFAEMSEKSQKELADSELDAVAGGKKGFTVGALFSTISLGILCAVMSIVDATKYDGCNSDSFNSEILD